LYPAIAVKHAAKRNAAFVCKRIVAFGYAASFAWLSANALSYDLGDRVNAVSLESTPASIAIPSSDKRWQYVDFWASWCAPCKQSFPWMNGVRESFAKRGVDIVAINVDSRRSDADRFLRQNNAAFAVAFDASGVAPKTFAVKSMPSAYLIDPDGRVRWIHRGFREGDGAKIEAEILKIVNPKQ
jgi:cytochrome c biogenesis protein CcmG, thiol:disulfide interchange protein DsbE